MAKCRNCGAFMKGSVCGCGYAAKVGSCVTQEQVNVLYCEICGQQGREIKGAHKDKQGKEVPGYLDSAKGVKILCFDCYYKYYALKGFHYTNPEKIDNDQKAYLTSLFYGQEKLKLCWCPMCNRKIFLSESFCFCGWRITKEEVMSAPCPKDTWAKHKPFIDEYQQLKKEGKIKSGYEYFKIKVGNTSMGKTIIKQVENPMPINEEENRTEAEAERAAIIAEATMPAEWRE